MKFEIGDVVRVENNLSKFNGETGVIIEMRNFNLSGYWINIIIDGIKYAFKNTELIKIEIVDFKPGDTIKINCPTHNYHNYEGVVLYEDVQPGWVWVTINNEEYAFKSEYVILIDNNKFIKEIELLNLSYKIDNSLINNNKELFLQLTSEYNSLKGELYARNK